MSKFSVPTEMEVSVSAFGDRVRIKESSETAAAGIAGLEGDIYGFTTPSVTSVEVIGGAPEDHALNVSVDKGTFWLRPDLVEFLHHNTGMAITVGNVKAVRESDGRWSESRVSQKEPSLWARLKAFFT